MLHYLLHFISTFTGFKKDLSIRIGEEFILNDVKIKIEDVRKLPIEV